MEENEFPCYYIDSDNASGRAQKTYKWLIWASLGLMFIATVVDSLSITQSFKQFSGLVVFASGLLTLALTLFQPEKNWYKGRAIAESLKTLSWRYMMHSSPFADQDEDVNLEVFTSRMSQINTQANREGFIPKPNKHHNEVITKKMTEVREMGLLDRKAFYQTERIDDQITWYGNKSNSNRRWAGICSVVIILAQLTAGIYLLNYNHTDSPVNLNAIMVFVATSVIGIVELYKFKDLHQAYALTKQELNLIKVRFGAITDDASLGDFVIEAEQAISREHTMWLARRGA